MEEMERVYGRAKEAGADAEALAKITVKQLTLEQLQQEYVSLCGLVAYYSKLERDQIGNPIRFFEDIRRSLKEGRVDQILEEEDPVEAASMLMLNRGPILRALAQVKVMLGEFSYPQEPGL
jgi:hypothetical protein